MENQSGNFYANAVNIASNIYDITFLLKNQSPQIDPTGKIMEIDGKPVINICEEIVVRMSPQHAKAFATLLVHNVKEYEKQFGIELPLTPELKTLWEKTVAK